MENELGKYLEKTRKELGYSLREVANLSDGRISHSYLSDLEHGVTRRGNLVQPSPDKLRTLSEIFRVSYSYLMSLAGYSENAPDWATHEDIIELDKMLNENVTMSFGGENLTEAEQQRVRDILTTLFWEKLQKKKGGANE